MKKTTKHQLYFSLRLLIGLALLLEILLVTHPVLAKPTSLTLLSRNSELSITHKSSQKRFRPGEAMQLKAGWHELQILAPQKASRNLRFWLNDGEQLRLPVELAPIVRLEPAQDWLGEDRRLTTAQLKTRSVCKWFEDRSLGRKVCFRDSWQDDLIFSEPDPFANSELSELDRQGELSTYRRLLSLRNQSEVSAAQAIEQFYAKHPSQSAAFRLAAHQSLVRGDCPRVHSILTEAQQSLAKLRPLIFYKALCSELQAQPEQAKNLLRDALALRDEGDASYLHYHLARLMLPSNPSEALQEAENCLQSSPKSAPCHEIVAMASSLLQRPYKAIVLGSEELTFKSFLKIESLLKEQQFNRAFKELAASISASPQSLELYLLLAWTEAVQDLELPSDFLDQKLQNCLILAPDSLTSIIETIEKQGYSRLLPSVYRNKIRGRSDDPNLWLRLVRSYSQASQCKEALAAIEEGSGVLPKFNQALLEIKGDCQLQLHQWKAASLTYKTLSEFSAPDWRHYQKLGFSYEQEKKMTEARAAYRKSLSLGPPEPERQQLELKLQKN